MEWNRYRVRPFGISDPDAEFDIEAQSPDKAASCLAQILGDNIGHRLQVIEVYINGRWQSYECHPKTVSVTTYKAKFVQLFSDNKTR